MAKIHVFDHKATVVLVGKNQLALLIPLWPGAMCLIFYILTAALLFAVGVIQARLALFFTMDPSDMGAQLAFEVEALIPMKTTLFIIAVLVDELALCIKA